MTRASKILNMLGEAIPQEQLKRAEVRKDNKPTTFESGAAKLGLKQSDVIGWFATKDNHALGYTIFEPTDFDKKEFGNDCFRIYSNNTDTANIVKLNLKGGMVSFLDGNAYENGSIKWQSPMPYNRLYIDGNSKAMKAFGVI
jgi:hypothetical protein